MPDAFLLRSCSQVRRVHGLRSVGYWFESPAKLFYFRGVLFVIIPALTNVFGDMLESVHPCVRVSVCVQNTSLKRLAGIIKSHLVTALVIPALNQCFRWYTGISLSHRPCTCLPVVIFMSQTIPAVLLLLYSTRTSILY